MKIYTKTGDKGNTSLFGGKRVEKDSLRISVNGSVDELNSLLGVVISAKPNSELINKIETIQKTMLRIGADIATRSEVGNKFENKIKRINEEDIALLESEIDEMTKELPTLTNFILPGGTKAAALTHHARSVCRRVERELYTLSKEEEINLELIAFFNRLSDWLFTLARYMNLENS